MPAGIGLSEHCGSLLLYLYHEIDTGASMPRQRTSIQQSVFLLHTGRV